MDVIVILFTWLHLLSAVIWVGGIIFILYIAIPSSRQALGTDAGKLMGGISKRFTPAANYSILLIVATGIALTLIKAHFNGAFFDDVTQSAALYLKYLLASVMIAVHFYRGLVLAPKITRAEPSQKLRLQNISMNLVKVNLWAGLVILALSAAVRTASSGSHS